MKTFFVKRKGSALLPVDAVNERVLWELKEGVEYQIKVSRPRNIKFHRKFFALLQAGFQLQDTMRDFESFRAYILLKSGFSHMEIAPDGTTIVRPKSISFAKMDETEFQDVYNIVIDVLLQKFGITKEAIEKLISFA